MNNKKIFIPSFAMFLIGCCSAIYIKGFGTFALSEPFLLLIAVLSLFKFIVLPKSVFRFAIFNLIWICGILISDFVNETDTEITAKLIGSALLIFFDTFAFYILIKRNKCSPIFFVCGNAISYLLQFYFFPPPIALSDFANFENAEHVKSTWIALTHYVPAISIAGIIWYLGWRKVSASIVFLSSLGALYYGSRAYFLIGIISSVLLWFSIKPGILFIKISNRKKYVIEIIKYSTMLIISIGISFLIYKEATLAGIFGDIARDKFLQQSSVNGFGLASGRLDFFQSIYAILHNPIIGYGSYAEDSIGIQGDFFKFMDIDLLEPKDLIPSHSHILGTWVWSGILALPFWLFILSQTIKSIFCNVDARFTAVILTYATFVTWHVLFSPIGYRVDLAFVLGMSLAYARNRTMVN